MQVALGAVPILQGSTIYGEPEFKHLSHWSVFFSPSLSPCVPFQDLCRSPVEGKPSSTWFLPFTISPSLFLYVLPSQRTMRGSQLCDCDYPTAGAFLEEWPPQKSMPSCLGPNINHCLPLVLRWTERSRYEEQLYLAQDNTRISPNCVTNVM